MRRLKTTDDWRELKIAAAANIKDRDYWQQKLSGKPVKTIFPTDHEASSPTPSRPQQMGAVESKLDHRLFGRITRLTKGSLYTMHVMLTAAVAALLYKYSDTPDILLGMPVYRQNIEAEPINTALVLRLTVAGDMTFKDLLLGVKDTVTEAVENQAYPLELLPEMLNLSSREGEFPLFAVAVLVENIQDPGDILHLNPGMIFSFKESEGEIVSRLTFNQRKYDDITAARILGHLNRLLHAALESLEIKLSAIDIMPEAERIQLLSAFERTGVKYPEDATIHELFEQQAKKTADRAAVVSLDEESGDNGWLTYDALNRRADQVAHLLLEKGVGADAIVGLLLERSPDMIAAIVGTLKAGAAYLPLDPRYPPQRIGFMLKDSGTRIVLTEHSLNGLSRLNHKQSIRPICSSLAYIIYTSGTTGRPKGVMIEHRNVVRLFFNDECPFDFRESDSWTMFHSYCFDFSVWEMYGALLFGAKLIVVPRMVTRDIPRYLDLLKRHGVTILNQTPSAFYHLMDEALAHPGGELALRCVIFGGEALNPLKLKGWQRRYPGIRLINMFGITETTVHVTYKEITARETAAGVSNIGGPIPTLSTYILDKQANLAPIGAAGELWVGGAGVSRGYLNRPELTAEKFVKSPFKPAERLYRSGDLARISAQGDLHYLGRLDHQVQIRGFRVEPGEVEAQLLRHDKIKEAVVLTRQDPGGDQYLTAYIVWQTAGSEEELRRFLGRVLPQYMIPAYVVPIDRIPLTDNNKLDRQALPEPATVSSEACESPADEIERVLVEMWSRILGVPPDNIGVCTNFFLVGGHSLKAVKLISGIHKEFDVVISIADIFKTPFIRDIAACIRRSGRRRHTAVEPAERREYYPMSAMQKRLYIVSQLDKGSTAYNLYEIKWLEGHLEPGQLESALRLLIRRHESLRTSFPVMGEEPVQVVHGGADVEVEYYRSGAELAAIDPLISRFIRPFELSTGPLVRAGVIEIAREKYVLMIDHHHIVSDGSSQAIFFSDLAALYEGRELPALKLQYRDFSQWQNSRQGRAAAGAAGAYWLRRFGGEIPKLDIYTDFPRPEVQSFNGSWLHFRFEPSLTKKIHRLMADTGTTLYMVLLAFYTVLLSRYTGQEDIVVGTPAAGREHGDFEDVIGLFINALPMRNYPGGEKTFGEFLEEVKTNTIDAFKNQAYPFDHLVERVADSDDLSRSPIFEAELLVQNMELPGWKLAGLKMGAYEFSGRFTQVDIALEVWEQEEEILFYLVYCTDLFKRETMERFAAAFRQIAVALLEDRDTRLQDVRIAHQLQSVETEVYQEVADDFEF